MDEEDECLHDRPPEGAEIERSEVGGEVTDDPAVRGRGVFVDEVLGRRDEFVGEVAADGGGEVVDVGEGEEQGEVVVV